MADTALFQDPLVGLEQVDMMAAGHGTTITGAMKGPDQRHGKPGVLKPLDHFFSDLETLRADAWAYNGLQVVRVSSESLSHKMDCMLGYLQDRSFPAGMNGRYDAVPGVGKENRNTVGRPNTNCDAGEIRDKSIIPFQFLP